MHVVHMYKHFIRVTFSLHMCCVFMVKFLFRSTIVCIKKGSNGFAMKSWLFTSHHRAYEFLQGREFYNINYNNLYSSLLVTFKFQNYSTTAACHYAIGLAPQMSEI